MVRLNLEGQNPNKDYSIGELKRHIEFSASSGRKFKFGEKELSLNEIMASAIEDLKTSDQLTSIFTNAERIDELRRTFKELKDSGYGDRGKIREQGLVARAVIYTRRALGNLFTRDPLKELEKLGKEKLKAIENSQSEGSNKWIILGEYNELGIGMEKPNLKEALDLYHQSASKGDPEGRVRYGKLLLKTPHLTDEIKNTALEQFTLAANNGNAEAQYMLGQLGGNADGSAVYWYEQAAWNKENPNAKARFELGKIYAGSNKPEGALAYYELSAHQGNADAQAALGQCFFSGLIGNGSTEINMKKAKDLFQLAADQGNVRGLTGLADVYLKDKKDTEAFKYYGLAAKQNDPYGQMKLGDCFVQGIGCIPDRKEALKYYKLAADQKLAEAQYKTAFYIEKDDRGDRSEAFEYYQKAAGNGNADAQFSLGEIYQSGRFHMIGCEKNLNVAIDYYTKALEKAQTKELKILAQEGINECNVEKAKKAPTNR